MDSDDSNAIPAITANSRLRIDDKGKMRPRRVMGGLVRNATEEGDRRPPTRSFVSSGHKYPRRIRQVRCRSTRGGTPRQSLKTRKTPMPYVRDPRVDAYLDRLPDWQREICSTVRDLVHEADPDVEETIKRTVQPYFVLDGNVCALLAAKDHVSIFLYDGAIVPDPEGIITAGHGNETGRTIAVRRDEKINERALVTMFRQIIANNRAGGWRRLKREASPPPA